MAPPKPGTNDAPTAADGEKTILSDVPPYDDEPPRLSVALNDALTDFPEGTALFPGTKVVKSHEIKEADLYKLDTITNILTWIDKRVQGVPLDEAWATQEGPTKKWVTDPKEEAWARAATEVLFGVTYGGPGPGYWFKGRKNKADFPAHENWESYVFSRIQRTFRSYRFSIGHIITPKGASISKEWGCHNIHSWKTPEPIDEEGNPILPDDDGTDWLASRHKPEDVADSFERPKNGAPWKEETNDDPAVPIMVACQQLTSFGALTRGFRLEHLNDVGYAAQSCRSYALFNGNPAGGAWYPIPPDPVVVEGETKPPEVSAIQARTSELLTVSKALKLSPPLGVGTIYTYDPDAGETKIVLYMSKYEELTKREEIAQEHFAARTYAGQRNIKSLYTKGNREVAPDYVSYEQARQPIPNQTLLLTIKKIEESIPLFEKTGQQGMAEKQRKLAQRFRNQVDKEYKLATAAWQERLRLAKDRSLHPVELPEMQHEGSHISYVMRVRKDIGVIQLMDTSNGGVAKVPLILSGRGAIIGDRLDRCIIDGNKMASADDGQSHSFVGIGVTPPPPEDLEVMAKHIRKARSIGLFRVILTKRVTTWGDTGLLFISQLCRMYGADKEKQNYWISKMLWGLRNTPGFTTVRPWIMFFLPRGTLARSMYAMGAREMTLSMFLKETASKAAYSGEFGAPPTLKYRENYIPVVVISNWDDRPVPPIPGKKVPGTYAGKAALVRRWRNASSAEGEFPEAIEQRLMTLPWNEMLVHPSFGADAVKKLEASIPAMFRDGGGASSAATDTTYDEAT